MEPVEHSLKGSAQKEALDAMKAIYGDNAPPPPWMSRHMTFSNTGIVSPSAIVHQWKRSQFLGTH